MQSFVSLIYHIYLGARKPCRKPAPKISQKLQGGCSIIHLVPGAVLCHRISAWPWENHEKIHLDHPQVLVAACSKYRDSFALMKLALPCP